MPEHSQAVVIDLGSGTIKGGLNDSALPQTVFESVLGFPEYFSPHVGCRLAPELDPSGPYQSAFRTERLVERGKLIRGSDLALIVERVYHDFSVSAELGFPLFLSAPMRSSVAERLALVTNAIEGCGAAKAFVANQAVLPLFALGRLDGFVVESGEGLTQAVGVLDGVALSRSAERIDLGGGDVSRRLQYLLRRRGEDVGGAGSARVVDALKRAVCECSLLQPEEVRFQFRSSFYGGEAKKRSEQLKFELPDGREIAVGQERQAAAEVLFGPWQAGLPGPGVAELADHALRRLEPDTRRLLAGQVLLSGGNAMISGFQARFTQELEPLMAQKNTLRVSAPDGDQSTLVWKGGAALTRLSAFEPLWITAKDLAEKGERVLLEKII